MYDKYKYSQYLRNIIAPKSATDIGINKTYEPTNYAFRSHDYDEASHQNKTRRLHQLHSQQVDLAPAGKSGLPIQRFLVISSEFHAL